MRIKSNASELQAGVELQDARGIVVARVWIQFIISFGVPRLMSRVPSLLMPWT